MISKDFLDWFDDKTQVIIALLILGMLLVWHPDAASAVDNIVSGLLGVAVGKGWQRISNGNGSSPSG